MWGSSPATLSLNKVGVTLATPDCTLVPTSTHTGTVQHLKSQDWGSKICGVQKDRMCLASALHCDPPKTEKASDIERRLKEGNKGDTQQTTYPMNEQAKPIALARSRGGGSLTVPLTKSIPPLRLPTFKKHPCIAGAAINIAGAIFNLLEDTFISSNGYL